MALTLEQQKRLSVSMVLSKEMGMSKFAAATFTHQWKRMHACNTAHLSEMLRAAIYHHIDDYRKQTYDTFGMGFLVSPASSSKSATLEPMELTLPFLEKVEVGYRRYTFAPYHNDKPPKTMHVRLRSGGIQVFFRGSWKPISAYLNEVGTENTVEQFDAELALRRQSEWWKNNGKTFDLNKLPAELREIVYGHVLPVMAQPHRRRKCKFVAPNHTMALMRTNKRIHDEVKHVLYQTKTFLIQHYPVMTKTVCNKLLQQNIRHLTLSFSNNGYLNLFHFDPKSITFPFPLIYPELREMKLKTFEFHIATPSYTQLIENACQVAAVDLILSLAWPSVKGHPIKISGWIKTSQKERIESLANDEKAAFDKWARLEKTLTGEDAATLGQYDVFNARIEEQEHGGVRLDGKACDDDDDSEENLGLGLVSMLKTDSVDYYLQCRCVTTCSAADWSCGG